MKNQLQEIFLKSKNKKTLGWKHQTKENQPGKIKKVSWVERNLKKLQLRFRKYWAQNFKIKKNQPGKMKNQL